MTDEIFISCQQTNTIFNLLPKCRYLESANAKKVLNILNSLVYKCFIIGCLPHFKYFIKVSYNKCKNIIIRNRILA